MIYSNSFLKKRGKNQIEKIILALPFNDADEVKKQSIDNQQVKKMQQYASMQIFVVSLLKSTSNYMHRENDFYVQKE